MLNAERVSFRYRPRAPLVVDDVSLTIAPGDLVGILGPNGSGKTTLLKMLSGTLAPSAGTIAFDGRPLAEWKRRDLARRIALVPQETHAPFDFTVLDIVLMGRFPHLGAFALEGPADLAIAQQALASTGTVGLRGSAVRDAERRREAARRDRQRAGAEPRAAAARRADGVARSRPSARRPAAARRASTAIAA